jgi:hypothetical protein
MESNKLVEHVAGDLNKDLLELPAIIVAPKSAGWQLRIIHKLINRDGEATLARRGRSGVSASLNPTRSLRESLCKKNRL